MWPGTPGPKPKPGEVLITTHHKSWEDKEKCRKFARSLLKPLSGNVIRIFKTKKGWGFHVLLRKSRAIRRAKD